MAERNQIGFIVPFFIKKHIEIKGTVINDFINKNTNQASQLLLQSIILPDPVKICISLQNVQMSIHGLLFICIFCAETQIVESAPFSAECLKISFKLIIKTIFLNQSE